MTRQEKPINVAAPIATLREARNRARNLVPAQAWDWLEGGTEREWSVEANEAAFRQLALVPRILRDVSQVETGANLFGHALPFPLIGAPLGGLTQYHADGEIALTQGCAGASSVAALSAMSRLRIEEVRQAATQAKLIYQIYFQGPDEWIESEVRRALDIDVMAICLCGDAPVRTMRYRDRENRYDARRFGRYTNSRPPAHELGARATWQHVEAIRKMTTKPLIVKGIMHAEDAARAVAAGADAVWVSNHGGRALDSGLASLYILPEIRAAVGKATVIFDGGIRTGSDILRALAMGADIAAVGRPLVYGLAVDGAAGVQRMFDLFAEEFHSAMAMCGLLRPSEIGCDAVRSIPTAESALAVLQSLHPR